VLITNTDTFGGDLWTSLFSELKKPNLSKIRIVSGYVGAETVTEFTKLIPNFDGLEIQLIVGMAYKEGLSQKTYNALTFLNGVLLEHSKKFTNDSGVFIYFADPESKSRERGIHAKGYLVSTDNHEQLFLGSSNFSFSGLNKRGNVELNISELDGPFGKAFKSFFDDFFVNKNAAQLSSIQDFPIRGQASKSRKQGKGILQRTAKPIDFKSRPFVDIDLARNIDYQQKSNLNTCFGKGRWARATNKVTPRDWYEIEIISDNTTTSSPVYPKGDFWITTSDGFRFEARTQGDYFKNLRSKEDLKIMGLWIKGEVLEDSGCLTDDPQELVTLDTFEKYGNSVLRLYQISPSEYVAHFPRNEIEL
jgi:hypothetical protein